MTLCVYSLSDPSRRLYPLPREKGEPRSHYVVRYMYALAHAEGIGMVIVRGRTYAREIARRAPRGLAYHG